MGVALNRRGNDDTSTGMLRRVQAGDDKAWTQFANRCALTLEQWAQWQGLQLADAQDLSQNALLVVLSKINEFRRTGRGSLRAWLRAIAWRCLWSARGKSFPQLDPGLIEHYLKSEEQISQLEEHFDRLQQLQVLQEAMQSVRERVSDRTWEAFRLTAIDDTPGSEVSSVLGMSIDAVYSARLRVQRLISSEIRRRQNSQSVQN